MTQSTTERTKKVPPHVPLVVLRKALGLRLDDVVAKVNIALGKDLDDPKRFARGSMSAIELGHRGASKEILAALEIAYGMEPGSITTSYAPFERAA